MNNTVLRILSAILAIGALAVGLLAIKLSQGPSAPASVPAAAPQEAVPTVAVATSARAIKAGQTIVASDVAVKGVQGPPANAFKEIPDLLGRMAATDIPAGTPLVPSHFAADSIAYLLKSGERAVGIQVDEVSSVGGFIKPGEHVDVLAYVPPTDERNNRLGASTVVIQDARVLTIGDASKIEQDLAKDKSDSMSVTMAKESGLKVAAEIQTRRMNLKSAVLAVKDSDVNRLMTAATVGQVRLALRPPASFDANAQLGQGQGKNRSLPSPSTTLDMTIKRPKEPQEEDARKIIIQEGSKELEQGAPKNNRNSIF
jgi:pilus assembly protein CpaB